MKVIALNGDYGYLDKIETTIKSIIVHNKSVKIYIINPDIPHEWFVNLNHYLRLINSQVVDSKVDPAFLQKMHATWNHISSTAYGRLLIPEEVKEDKVLYLDCDLIIDANLDDLYNTDLEDKMLYAVRDYNSKDGEFNSGVMLINNRLWRDEHVLPSLIEMGQNPNMPNGDQTVINTVFHNKIGELDPTYNHQIGYDALAFLSNDEHLQSKLDAIPNPKIIHYVTEYKPFNLISLTSLRDKWWKYRNLEWSKIISEYIDFDNKMIEDDHFDGGALIMTNVAEIQNIESLIQAMPNVRIYIAAHTLMAFDLLRLTKYDNVKLYPSIIGKVLDKLINETDVYLDINYGTKVTDVMSQIVQNNTPIFSFDKTRTQDLDYDNYHVYHDNQVNEMVDAIQQTIKKSKSNS